MIAFFSLIKVMLNRLKVLLSGGFKSLLNILVQMPLIAFQCQYIIARLIDNVA
jgi:hypothetical protein